jgi:Zn-dependent protease with chaperone function
MNIFINQDGQPVGPFSREQLQNKIYSGELSRSVSARPEGSVDWQPLESLMGGQAPPKLGESMPPVAMTLDQLRDGKEKKALIWLYIASVPVWLFIIAYTILGLGIPLVVIGFIWLLVVMGELWFAAHLKTNAIRVSETQLPELHRAVQAGCGKLGMACPDVYVLQHNVWNAFATKIFGRRMVVLFSGAVDSILLKGDMQQLSWVVGHELGHHWAGHLDFKQKLAKPGSWLIWVAFWHSRRRELTCDRVGLYCAGSLQSSQLALANLTVGAQLAGRVNTEQAVAQWHGHRGEFFVKYRTFYSTYPHLLARMDHLNQAAQEFGMSR